MKMKDLLDRQSRIHNDLKGIMSSLEGGDLSPEQETRAADLQAEMAKVKRLIDVQADIDEAERRMSGTPVIGDPKLDTEMRSFSLNASPPACSAMNAHGLHSYCRRSLPFG